MAKLIDLKTGLDLTTLLRHWEAEELTEEVNEEEDFATHILNSTLDGIFAFDRNCVYTIWNRGMEQITGLPKNMALGRSVFDVFPLIQEPNRKTQYEQVLLGKIMITEDVPYQVPATGREGIATCVRSPLYDETGKVTGGLGVVRDVSEQHQALKEIENLRFLADAGIQLSESLELKEVLQTCLHLVSRRFHGAAIFRLLGEEWSLGDRPPGPRNIYRFMTHVDLASQQTFEEIARKYPLKSYDDYGPIHVLLTGETSFVPVFSNERWVRHAQNEQHLRELCELGVLSHFAVPLIARNRIIGSLSVYSSTRFYTDEDLHLGQAIARRCAIALDNARLFRNRGIGV